MHQRRPHRFFLGLFTFALVAIHLQSRASDLPDSMTGSLSAPAGEQVPSLAPPPGLAPPPAATAHGDDSRSKWPALCDTGEDPNHPKAGIGGPIEKFDKWGTPKSQKQIQDFVTKQKQAFDQLSSYHEAAEYNASLQAAQNARLDFFNESYGVVKKPPAHPSATITICYAKKALGESVAAFNNALSTTDANGVDVCKGAAQKLNRVLQSAQYANQRYAAVIEAYLGGGSVQLGDKDSKLTVPSIVAKFQDDSKTNHDKLSGISEDPAAAAASAGAKGKTPQANQGADSTEPRIKALVSEYDAVWGKDSYKGGANPNYYSKGMFSELLAQVRQEKLRAQESKDGLAELQNKMAPLQAQCGLSATSPTAVPTPSASDPGKEDIDPITGKSKVRSGISGLPGDRAAQPAIATPDTQDTPDTTQPPPKSWGVAPPVADHDTPDNTPPAANPPAANSTTGEMGSFLKNNWMYLAGGVLLVGGGVWLYNQYQQQHAYDYVSPLYVPPMTFSNTSVITATASMSSTLTSTGVTITTVTGTNGSVSTAR